ncbi:MAG TPA: hypothetical protein DHV96_03865 [Lachnospiraceae bacterium]|nr:hypothetical protein [Lachnospiraceae bacterium]
MFYRKVRPIKQERSAKDAHLAKKIIVSQFLAGAKELQMTLCSPAILVIDDYGNVSSSCIFQSQL